MFGKLSRILWMSALTVMVLLSACGDATIENQVSGYNSETSVHSLLIDSQNREFIVYRPKSLDAMVVAPVVFVFHGTSGDGEKFYNISRWREKADLENFIAVFPSALVHCFFDDDNGDGIFSNPRERRVTSKWASGLPGSSHMPLCSPSELATLSAMQRELADHALADDVSFVREMLDFLVANYNADEKRTYATGFSNGGGMVSRLVAEMPERFAAAAAAAGRLTVQPYPVDPRSFVLSIGNVDAGFTVPLGLSSLPLSETLLSDYPIIKTMGIDPMLTLLQLGDSHRYEEVDMAGQRTSHYTFSEDLTGANNSHTLIIIEDLGHQYPNGINHPIVLADYLWEFFKHKKLP